MHSALQPVLEIIPIVYACSIFAIYSFLEIIQIVGLSVLQLEESEGRKFFQQIISGVDYCHRHMVVHR